MTEIVKDASLFIAKQNTGQKKNGDIVGKTKFTKMNYLN